MKKLAIALAIVVSFPAAAQQPYAAPEQDLWIEMKAAASNIPMSLSAHQQLQQIFATVERESQIRASRKVPEDKTKEKKQ